MALNDRELVVRVVGDASGLDRTFKQASRSATTFGRDISKTSRGAIAGAGAFRGLGRSIAFASAGFLGGFGLTAAIRAAFDEMSQAQKASAQTAAAIKSTGGVAGVTAKHVDTLATSLLNLSGVDDEAIKGAENLLLTFTNIRNVVGRNNDIFDQATKAALDLSVRFDKDLGSSAILVGKALQDPVKGLTALSRAGVQFTKGQQKQIKGLVDAGKVLEAQKVILAELRVEVGGSAKALGDTLPGKLNILKQSVLNLSGASATQLGPSIGKVVDRLNAWIQKSENQKRILDTVRAVVSTVGDVVDNLRAAFEGLNTITGSTKNTFKILLGLYITFKALKLASYIGTMATQMGLFAANSKKAAGAGVGGAAGAGGRPARPPLADRLGLVGTALGPAIVLSEQIRKIPFWEKAWRTAGGKVFDVLQEDIGAFKNLTGLVDKASKDVRPPAGALGPIADVARRAKRPGVTPPPPKPVDPKFRRAANEAARQAAVDRAQLAVDRTALTKSVADDIAALNKLNALLKRRIAGGHDTIEIEREQLGVQLQLNQILEEQAKAQKEAARKRRDARQFRLLGFGPTGEDIVPGVKTLKRQLASVTDAIEGGFLDTNKTRARLRGIRRVLAEGIGHVSADVRAKIAGIIADLKAQLKQSSVDVTRFQKTARGQLTLAGAHPTGGGAIHVHVNIDGKEVARTTARHNENEFAKRQRQRANARRSTR